MVGIILALTPVAAGGVVVGAAVVIGASIVMSFTQRILQEKSPQKLTVQLGACVTGYP